MENKNSNKNSTQVDPAPVEDPKKNPRSDQPVEEPDDKEKPNVIRTKDGTIEENVPERAP